MTNQEIDNTIRSIEVAYAIMIAIIKSIPTEPFEHEDLFKSIIKEEIIKAKQR